MSRRSPWFALLLSLSVALGLLGPASLAAPHIQIATPTATPGVQGAAGIQVEAALQAELAVDSTSGYLIVFRQQADLSPAYGMDWEARGEYVVRALQETAEDAQADVRAFLDAQGVSYQAFWVDNVIAVEASNVATLNGLMAFGEIGALKARRTAQLIEPQIEAGVAGVQAAGVEPNIAHVGADGVWAQGIDGSGQVVASIDTGVRYTHNALAAQYRGNLGGGTFDHDYNWLGAVAGRAAPTDSHGHGTHTMGTMVGDDGAGNQIGMAPGAQWIACEACHALVGCPDVSLLTCGQWVLAPYPASDPSARDASRRPSVVNNSWGDCGQAYDGWYKNVVNAWVAAGIYPVFSAGNASNCGYSTPPGCGTVGNPARYANVTAVGSTGTSNGLYASHSNKGPGDRADTLNPLNYPYLKPQVAAPGVNIRSSVPGSDSSYEAGWNGTSMSAPHVSGLVALLWQAAPGLQGDYAATETIIQQSATPIAYATGCSSDGPGGYPNCATGWGEIDAVAALAAARAYCHHGTLSGRITAAEGGAALAGVQVSAAAADGLAWAMASDAAGDYALSLPAGSYTVTITAEGYVPAVRRDLAVAADGAVGLDAALTVFVPATLSGNVADAETGWPLYARVEIPDLGGEPTWTDPATGAYSIAAAAGVTLTVSAEAWAAGYLPAETSLAPLSGDGTLDVTLSADAAACTAPGRYVTGDGDCRCREGGLLVGQVAAGNTGDPLAGAQVSMGGEGTALAGATDDPQVGDAFYTLFSARRTAAVTATMSGGYGPATATVGPE